MQAGRECYIDCSISIKEKATELNKYHGIVKASLIRYSFRAVKRGTDGPIQYEDYRRYYDHVKRNLIPGLFDSPEDFEQDPLVSDIYKSRDFNEFLFLRLRYETERLNSEYVSRKNFDYRIGHVLMRFPRYVRKLLQR